MPKTEAEIVN